MKISDTRERLVGGMYRYVENIVTYAMQKNKKLIVWGCGKGGAFLRHLVVDVDGRIEISYYIDEHMVLPCCNEALPFFRSSLLWYLPKDEYVILLSIRRDENVESMLDKLGFQKNKNYFDVRSEIGGNYLEYLELQNNRIDFSYVTKEERPDLYGGEYFESKPFDHSSIDRVFDEMSALPCEKNFFDIGCGKGQMLMMSAMNGMKKIGGIEFNTEIAQTARKNMKELHIEADVIISDATEYEEVDEYNIFFLYNPFGEESIRRVVAHIYDSYKRRPRSMFLVYGNPFYHATVMEHGNITIHRQVRVDLHDPILNIYRIGERI